MDMNLKSNFILLSLLSFMRAYYIKAARDEKYKKFTTAMYINSIYSNK